MLTFGEQTFAPYAAQLRGNIANGTVAALAVVATDRAERSTVFTELSDPAGLPPTNAPRGIDYRRTTIDYRHVLASSAIPGLFRPIDIDDAYFVDGGVRLNVPLAPAVALGATHLVAVATHPATYAAEGQPSGATPPDLVDAIVGVLGSALADRMVEDLATLDALNALAPPAPGPGPPPQPRLIQRVFVGPHTRQEIGELAAEVYAERHRGRRVVRELDFRILHRLIGPREPGNGDLMSYLLFDAAFLERAVELGQACAQEVIAGPAPWLPPANAQVPAPPPARAAAPKPRRRASARV
jgi:NTE family protein